ncbi:MAG TPA: hypothetical protein VJS14_15085 [Enterobacteriaceae bacterium]|nr:hypothetical protein [Enterobacteriaceae bacterium]
MPVRKVLTLNALRPVHLSHILGAAAVIAGLLFWGARLISSPDAGSATPQARTLAPDPAGENVAAWLGTGEVRLNVVVNGIMTRPGRAVALLSVNEAPPVPYVPGEYITREVRLQSVDSRGVVLNYAGREIIISAPEQDAPSEDLIILSTGA